MKSYPTSIKAKRYCKRKSNLGAIDPADFVAAAVAAEVAKRATRSGMEQGLSAAMPAIAGAMKGNALHQAFATGFGVGGGMLVAAVAAAAPSALSKVGLTTANVIGIGAFEKGKAIALIELKNQLMKAGPLEIIAFFNYVCELNMFCKGIKKGVEIFTIGFFVKKAYTTASTTYLKFEFERHQIKTFNQLSMAYLESIRGNLDADTHVKWALRIVQCRSASEAFGLYKELVALGKK